MYKQFKVIDKWFRLTLVQLAEILAKSNETV